jgi:hypothetical protein
MNAEGEVIGIATMMLRGGQNLNYAVPVRYVRPLISTGERPQRFDPSLLPRPNGGLAMSTGALTDPETQGNTDDRWEAQVFRQLNRLERIMSDNGLSRSHEVGTEALNQNQSGNFTIGLQAGRQYGIVGVCDTDCRDLDLALVGPNGSVLERDISDDDLPFLLFRAKVTGTYKVRVAMARCLAGPCRYGVTAFIER